MRHPVRFDGTGRSQAALELVSMILCMLRSLSLPAHRVEHPPELIR